MRSSHTCQRQIVGHPNGSPSHRKIYDKLAPRYDRLHNRWLRGAGAPAQAALEGAVRALLRSRSRVLDVGCGTGHFARRLVAEGFPASQITLVDASAAMIAATSDLQSTNLQARIELLPFPSDHFDIVTCAWVLETLGDPSVAIQELCRVVRPGGAICIAFCANRQAKSFQAWLLRQAIGLRRTGRFLDPGSVTSFLAKSNAFEVRSLPCDGVAAALIAHAIDGEPNNTNHKEPARSL